MITANIFSIVSSISGIAADVFTTTRGPPTPLPHDPPRDRNVLNPLTDAPIIPHSDDQAWQRLISNAVPQDELASLIETVFSKENAPDLVDSLQREHVQTFVNVIDAVRDHALRSPKDGSTDSTQFYVFVRHWIALTLHRGSEGYA